MANKRTVVLCLAVLAGLAAAATAHADDTDILNKATPSPNVVIILDTSTSMTWYNSTGATYGDEYIAPSSCPGGGWGASNANSCTPPPMARMAMAKIVLSSVVDTFFDKLRLGLASYAENGTSANPNADVRIKRYFYYCGNDGAYCTSATGSGRYYLSFIPPTSSLAGGGTNTVWNNLHITTDATNINMPSQSSFAVTWNLDTSYSNPVRGGPYTSGGSSASSTTYCTWDYTITYYNTSGAVTSTSSGTEDRGTTPCQPNGTTGTLKQNEIFDKKATGDDPNPYKYNLQYLWTGYNLYNPGCYTPCVDYFAYNANRGTTWTDWQKVYRYNGKTHTVTTTASATKYYYQYTWYYKGTCTSGCTGYLTTSRSVNTALQNGPNPIPAAPAAPLTVPFNRTYTWVGNNYEIAPPSAENSCAVGTGITMLVDVGGGDQTTLHNYLGTGTDKTKELHGANNYTPLAQSLNTTTQYLLNPTGPVQTDPQINCRRNFVILVTDGGESCALVPTTGPGSPGSYAAALLAAPINQYGGAPTYVVGLDAGNLGPDEKTVLADIAAKGSTSGAGKYYSAANPVTLTQALNAVIGSILSQQYEFVSPVVPTMRTSDNLMLIQGAFTTPASPPASPNAPLWQGSLTAYPLTSTGTIATSAQRISATPLWEAGAKLATTSAGSRVINTVIGGALTAFAKTNPVRNAMNVTIDVDGNGTVNPADADKVIDTVRGASSGTNGFLGDIFHSTPIVVGPPSGTYADRTFDPANPSQLLSPASAPDTFALFRTAQGTRQRVVLVGANDGMLHAFNAGTYDSVSAKYNTGDGSEVWGFIPPQLLTNLQYLAVNQGHRYYVDASPRVADVWIDSNNDGVKAADGSEWKTVLVGGFRQGGTGLYALDITDTTNPQFLWTFNTTGQSWSEPAFGKVKVQVNSKLVDRWVVFVGDGYDPGGTNGKLVHVIDIQTGMDLWRFPTNDPVAAGPITLDLNSDGYVDRVYVGTTGGDLLRLDVSAVGKAATGGSVLPNLVATCASVPTSSSTCWYGSTFFSAGAGQPFYTKMAATTDPEGNLWLFAGSGDRSNPLLVPATPNRSYGIKDGYPSATATLAEANLTDVTNVNGGNGSLDPSTIAGSGWFIQFRSGEKEWAEVALVFNSQVFFTTFLPAAGGHVGCGDVGSGSVYMVYYLTGGGVTDTALFQADPPQASSRIYEVNAGVTTRPVVTTGLQGTNAVVYFANSNGLTITPKFSTPSSIRSTRYWRRLLP